MRSLRAIVLVINVPAACIFFILGLARFFFGDCEYDGHSYEYDNANILTNSVGKIIGGFRVFLERFLLTS